MTPEEIDEWYEEEKQKLVEEYRNKIKKDEASLEREYVEKIKNLNEKQVEKISEQVNEKRKKIHEKHESWFTSKLDELHRKYEEKSYKLAQSNLRRYLLKNKLKLIKAELIRKLRKIKFISILLEKREKPKQGV